MTTWTELEESVKTGRVSKAILPIGSYEQHGPHLPLSTDTMIAEYVANKVSEKCEASFLLPSIQVGCSSEHLGFAGTISLTQKTMAGLIVDIAHSLTLTGFRRLFIINGHGGNKATIDSTLIEVKQLVPDLSIYSFTILDIVKQKFDHIRKSERGVVGHADEIETSMMLTIAPDCVNMSRAVCEKSLLPEKLSFESNNMTRISFAWKASEVTKSGVIGDPASATAETGTILLDFAIQVISDIINEL
ncbi:MAG TPA: creatininase family protein [Candidatus Acidoferrales bacterium]|nr:creatininase family protein [Candidatus Acidoferrales bacterium]